jgi:hypothetical protein
VDIYRESKISICVREKQYERVQFGDLDIRHPTKK